MEAPRYRLWFFLADCAGGAITGAVVALVIRNLVSPGMDMVVAMAIGMIAGTIVHLIIGAAMVPLLGMFEAMVPGMFIGMYGGMLFGMRDSMQSVPLAQAIVVGASLGVFTVAIVEFWNVQLRRQSMKVGQP